MSSDIKNKINSILAKEKKYAFSAYPFIADAVPYTVSTLAKERHVTAKELVEGVKKYAFSIYGALAPNVLQYWGVTQPKDVGKIVYLLIGVNILSASPDDDPNDFNIPGELFPKVKANYQIKEEFITPIDKKLNI
jgi:uncharacterized repeat protein (TIGR04138 family)